MDILKYWDITRKELSDVVFGNPSLRGFLFGYVAEFKLRQLLFSGGKLKHIIRYNNHDRGRKGDISFTYKGVEARLESKSLQTNSIRKTPDGLKGTVQCDASDRRKVALPNGETVETTCLLVGQFDVLAINLFEFDKKWQFAFALNAELPRSKYSKYTPEQQKHLLATSIPVTWPIKPPFSLDPFKVLNKFVRSKKGKPR